MLYDIHLSKNDTSVIIQQVKAKIVLGLKEKKIFTTYNEFNIHN